MRVVVDYDLCESNALCMAAAPEVFEVRDDDFLYVLQDEPGEELRDEGRGGRPPLPQASHHDRGLSSATAARGPRPHRHRRGLARRAARRRGAAHPRPRRRDHARRRRAAPPLRPAAAVQAGAGRHEAAGVDRARRRHAARPTTSTSTGGSASRPPGSTSADREVLLGGGERLGFDGLVIATGASPKRLPGTDHLDGVHTLRTLDDCLAIRAALDASPRRVAVVGAGFIGAEVAATCRGPRDRGDPHRGAARCRSSAASGPRWARWSPTCTATTASTCASASAWCCIEGGDRVERIRLTDGAVLDVDLVVVGIGVAPNTELARGLGPHHRQRRAVRRDLHRRARGGRRRRRGPLAQPALRRGDAGRALGQRHRDGHARRRSRCSPARRRSRSSRSRGSGPTSTTARSSSPGRAAADDHVEVVAGSVDERRFVALYGRDGRVVGVLGMNQPAKVMRWRSLIEERASWDDALRTVATAE